MHAEPQISAHEMGPPSSCSGGAMIHRLCTDQFIRARFPDKMPGLSALSLQTRSTRQTALFDTKIQV